MWLESVSPLVSRQEVHVWRAEVDSSPPQIQKYVQTLSTDELARTARLQFQKHRYHFIVARGILRMLLGRYLGIAAKRVRFQYNPYGKPALTAGSNQTGLTFNLAHSHEMLLLAVSRCRSLGIDVEYLRDDLPFVQLAKQFFSPQEIAELNAIPAQQQKQAFYTVWTLKEAYIKMRGQGLSMPLDQFSISVTPGKPISLTFHSSNTLKTIKCCFRIIEPGPGYTAALAAEGTSLDLRCCQWSQKMFEPTTWPCRSKEEHDE